MTVHDASYPYCSRASVVSSVIRPGWTQSTSRTAALSVGLTWFGAQPPSPIPSSVFAA